VLVVDTVGIKTGRPFDHGDIFGAAYTDALHVGNAVGSSTAQPQKRRRNTA
jgi:hypothetical protein